MKTSLFLLDFLIQTWNLLKFDFFLQNFCVDLFSRREEVQKFREDKFSQIGENSAKSVKINPREN